MALFWRLFFKGCVLVWPWLKAAIFKDRTVMEVIVENKHLTGMLLLLCLLIGALLMTTFALSDTKDAYRVARDQLEQLHRTGVCIAPATTFDRARLDSLMQ